MTPSENLFHRGDVDIKWNGSFFPSFENQFWLFVIVKKQIDVSFLCVCPLIDDKFRHNIVKGAVYVEGGRP